MLNRSKKKAATSTLSDQSPSPVKRDHVAQALKRQLATLSPRHRDFIGGKEALSYVTRSMASADSNGVRVEDMPCLLGALCGYSCQIAAVSDIAGRKRDPVELTVARDGSEHPFFMGDALLKRIFDGDYSPWSLIGGGAERIGKRDIFMEFDIKELISHSVSTIGKPDFGIIRVEQKNQPRKKPQDFLEMLWKPHSEHLGAIIDDRSEWPACFGMAIQEAMVMSKDYIDAKSAITIVIESILTTSKVISHKIANQYENEPGITKQSLASMIASADDTVHTTPTQQRPVTKLSFWEQVRRNYAIWWKMRQRGDRGLL